MRCYGVKKIDDLSPSRVHFKSIKINWFKKQDNKIIDLKSDSRELQIDLKTKETVIYICLIKDSKSNYESRAIQLVNIE